MGIRSLTSAVLFVFPKYKCFLLRKPRTRSEIIHLILTWYCCSVHSPHSHFAICLINVLLAKENFPGPRSNPGRCVVFRFHVSFVPLNLGQFFSHSFGTLTFLKSTGHWFCGMSFIWGLPGVSFWLDLDYTFLAKYKTKQKNALEVMFCPSQQCCEWTWLTWFRCLFAVKLLFLASWFLSIPPIGDSVTVLSPIRLAASSFSTLLIFAWNSFYCDGHQTVIFQLCYSFCIYLLHILL